MALRLLHRAGWRIGRICSRCGPDDAAALSGAWFRVAERPAALACERAVHALVAACRRRRLQTDPSTSALHPERHPARVVDIPTVGARALAHNGRRSKARTATSPTAPLGAVCKN